MKFTGENTLPAPVEQVWDALLDPAVTRSVIEEFARRSPAAPDARASAALAEDLTTREREVLGR